MFVNTLQPPFYEHMIGNWNISSNFVDIIIIGERIETGLKNGKIAYGPPAAANTKKPGFNQSKKKEVEVHVASAWDNHTPVNYQYSLFQSISCNLRKRLLVIVRTLVKVPIQEGRGSLFILLPFL